jgi:hypothetical protein
VIRRRRLKQQPELLPEDPRFWRQLRPGVRLAVRPAQSDNQPAPAGRLELEVTGVRAVAVQDDKGGLLLEYLLFEVNTAGAFSTLAVVIAGSNLSIRIATPLDDGSAASREELAERLGWLFDRGAGEPQYARCPAMPVAGRELALSFAAALAAPLRGDYAAPGSDRASALLIVEYAALEPCEEPFLIVLEDVDRGRVTVLTAAALEPRQFRA